MSKRSYQQYCPLAHSLDIIGERWTLLIVRELTLGPRRFSDLQRGLPGIGPTLLSQRLTALVETGIIEAVHLPPPARLQAYALTASGQALNAALRPLAEWGTRWLQRPIPEEEFLGAIPAVMALQLMYREPIEAAPAEIEIRLEPDIFVMRTTKVGLAIDQGLAPRAPLRLATTPKGLLGLALGGEDVASALAAGSLELAAGSPDAMTAFLAQFGPPRSGA